MLARRSRTSASVQAAELVPVLHGGFRVTAPGQETLLGGARDIRHHLVHEAVVRLKKDGQLLVQGLGIIEADIVIGSSPASANGIKNAQCAKHRRILLSGGKPSNCVLNQCAWHR